MFAGIFEMSLASPYRSGTIKYFYYTILNISKVHLKENFFRIRSKKGGKGTTFCFLGQSFKRSQDDLMAGLTVPLTIINTPSRMTAVAARLPRIEPFPGQ